MSQPQAKHLDIAIVGGGPTGLTCAVALARKGIFAHVYEAKPLFGEIGVGIGLGPNALRILDAIGVLQDAFRMSDEQRPTMNSWTFLSGMGAHELIYDYPTTAGNVTAGLPRYSLVKAMASHIDPKYAHHNKRCINISSTQSNPSRSVLHFSDGTSAEADAVLICSGIKSPVRGAVTGKNPMECVSFSNTICYRALVPTEQAKAGGVKTDFADRLTCFVGQDKHFIIFPIKGGKLINVVAFVADRTVGIGERNLRPDQPIVVPVSCGELMSVFDGWGDDVIRLLGCMVKATKWSINVVYPHLETYVKGNVALVGDAAHAMLPHLGAGAGQCIEDGFLLANLLSLPEVTTDNVETVLKVYDEVRRPRATSVWEGSLRQGENYECCGKSGPTPDDIRTDLAGSLDFVWNHALDEDTKNAVSRLRELGVL